MFSTEINNLLNGNNLEVLKLLSQYNPEQFRKNVNELSKEGDSFFLSFFKKNDKLEYVSGLLSLCESFGYSFSDKEKKYEDKDIHKIYSNDQDRIYLGSSISSSIPMNQKNPQVTPEYISAFAYARTDETFAFLTEKIGKEKMLEMEKNGWPILEYAYRKRFSKTVELLCDYGLDQENTPSGLTILNIVGKEQGMIDLYWKMKDKKAQKSDLIMSDEQFKHFAKIIEENIEKIVSKKDYVTDNTVHLIEQKKDILSKEQKETLLISSLQCVDPAIYKSLAKMLGYTQKSKEIKNLIFPHLMNVRNHDYLYFIIEEKEYLFKEVNKGWEKSSNPSSDYYGIDIFAHKLSMLGINPSDKSIGNKKKESVNKAFFNRCYSIFYENENILFEKFSNGVTLFEKMALITSTVNSNGEVYSNNFLPFLNIRPRISSEKGKSLLNTIDEIGFNDIKNGIKKFTIDQKEQIRDFLEKTWLSKDENGKMLIEKSSVSVVANTDMWVLNNTLLAEEGIYTNEEKLKMLQALVERKAKSTWDSKIFKDLKSWEEPKNSDNGEMKLLKNLYLLLKEDPETKWSNLKFSEEAMKGLENSEFLFELKARQLSEELAMQLHQNKGSVLKPKMKI